MPSVSLPVAGTGNVISVRKHRSLLDWARSSNPLSRHRSRCQAVPVSSDAFSSTISTPKEPNHNCGSNDMNTHRPNPPCQSNTGAVSLFDGANNCHFNGNTAFNVFVQPFGSPLNCQSYFSGIILVDATGQEYPLPIELASCYESFKLTVDLLFKVDKMEARVQNRYLLQGEVDFCIDKGTKTEILDGQTNWVVQPGTKIVMRVILVKEYRDRDPLDYRCPRAQCATYNAKREPSNSFDCRGCNGRLQVTEADPATRKEMARSITFWERPRDETMLFRNIHLKACNGSDVTRFLRHVYTPSLQQSGATEEDILGMEIKDMVDITSRAPGAKEASEAAVKLYGKLTASLQARQTPCPQPTFVSSQVPEHQDFITIDLGNGFDLPPGFAELSEWC